MDLTACRIVFGIKAGREHAHSSTMGGLISALGMKGVKKVAEVGSLQGLTNSFHDVIMLLAFFATKPSPQTQI